MSVHHAAAASQPRRLAYTIREAAEAIALSERTIWQAIQDGRLKATKIGRAVRIPTAELERFVAGDAAAVDRKAVRHG
jgi:excisionase family DNA binding protein